MSELLQAIYRGDRARADELLAGDPELDVFEAAAVGRTERLRELLDEDPSLANAWAEDGFQPLGLASFFGHVRRRSFSWSAGRRSTRRRGTTSR